LDLQRDHADRSLHTMYHGLTDSARRVGDYSKWKLAMLLVEFLLSLEVLARGLRRHSTRTSVPPPPPRSSGVPARGHTERSQRASGVAAAPRPRAAGAPAARACAPAARPRAARAGACTHSNGHVQVRVVVVVVVVGDNSAKFSRQSSQNLGKYNLVIYF